MDGRGKGPYGFNMEVSGPSELLTKKDEETAWSVYFSALEE
jgi:hypothetical protein